MTKELTHGPEKYYNEPVVTGFGRPQNLSMPGALSLPAERTDSMKDPYRVLGLTAADTDSDVKKTYRRLVRQYGPNKDGKPASEEFAGKLRDIDAAYREIAMERGWPEGIEDEVYAEALVCVKARALITRRELDEAETVLDSIEGKSAEWYFLLASVTNRKGDAARALELLKTACSLDPKNNEYFSAMKEIKKNANLQERYTPKALVKRYWLDLVIYLFVFYTLPTLYNMSGMAEPDLQVAMFVTFLIIDPIAAIIVSGVNTWRHGFFWFTLAMGPIQFFPFIVFSGGRIDYILSFLLIGAGSGIGCLVTHLTRRYNENRDKRLRM